MTSVSLRVRNWWPRARELAHEFVEVVDFAIEDDTHGAVFVEQRLLTGGEIDDGQPAVP